MMFSDSDGPQWKPHRARRHLLAIATQFVHDNYSLCTFDCRSKSRIGCRCSMHISVVYTINLQGAWGGFCPFRSLGSAGQLTYYYGRVGRVMLGFGLVRNIGYADRLCFTTVGLCT